MITDPRDWIYLIRGGRGIGKTHAALTVAQALGRDCAVVVTTMAEARQVKNSYPGDYQVYTLGDDLRGQSRQLVFDPDAFCEILQRLIDDNTNRERDVRDSFDCQIAKLYADKRQLMNEVEELKLQISKRGSTRRSNALAKKSSRQIC